MNYIKDEYNYEKMSSWWIKLLAVIFGLFEILSITSAVIYIIINKELFQKLLEMENGSLIALMVVVFAIIHILIAFMFIFTIYRVGELTDERNSLREEVENLYSEIDKTKTEVIKHKYD